MKVRRTALLAAWLGLALAGCHSATAPAPPVESLPARVALVLTPGAESLFVGTSGRVSARAFDRLGNEMPWTASRRIESSDSSVLSVASDGALLARRVGFSRLRVSWVGRTSVSDSITVGVGYRGVGTVRLIPVEGGCWVIATDPLTALEVLELPAAFKVDGLRVRIVARPRATGSFCMVGIGASLDSIRAEAR
jgi:hypothetical protein